MAATNFKTENNTFRKLIGNGLSYRIPPFQRDYSWKEEEWEDLWADLLGTLRPGGEPGHYMGYLVLQSADDKTFDVIDGQQRLTTITILVLAVLNNLQRQVDAGNNPDANRQRIEQIRNSYIGYLDPVTLVARPKLVLNRNNDLFFRTYLVELRQAPQRNIRASENLLRKAFDWFDGKVKEHVAAVPDTGKRLAQLIEDTSDRLFFTVITVTDELNAYRVFETLNARGVRLSTTDLLKNYLFSVLDRQQQHGSELRDLEERWEAMVGRLGPEDFPDFLRVHWNSRQPLTRQSELFKTIRGTVTTSKAVFDLLRGMDEDLDMYLALTTGDAAGLEEGAGESLRTLRMFGVRQPFPLLLSARRRLDARALADLLRDVVVISLRFNVIGGYSTGEQERTYNEVALKLTKAELTTQAQVLAAMRGIYPADRAFKAAFAEKVLRTTQSRNSKVVRWILCAMEKHLTSQDLRHDSDAFNIEHVLPQNPGPGWTGFTDAEVEASVFLLGNMTLLRRDENSGIGNASYAEKRAVLQRSSFEVTRRLAAEHDDWNRMSVAEHQHWMASQAAAIWRINQLS